MKELSQIRMAVLDALRGGSKNVRRVMFVVLGLLFVKILVSFFQ